MSLSLTFPSLLNLEDLSLFIVCLVVGVVFGASGYFHLKDPVGRARSIELSPTATGGLGAAEALVGLGAIQVR